MSLERPNPDPRYSRQVILPGVGSEGQEKLRRARVLIAGLGGLGSPSSLYLAAAGVGTLGIADFDTVDRSNLHRQILHGDQEVGSSKCESAKVQLLRINPDLAIEMFPKGITTDNARSLFEQFDLVVDGTDNFAARYLINDAAFLTGKPVIHGSIYQFEGQVSIFHPLSGAPCYRCLFPSFPDPATAPNCAEAGVFGSLCGVIGSWQASEAIKWIIGIGEPLLGKVKMIDSLSGKDRVLSLSRNPQCPLCGDSPSITGIEADNYTFQCETSSLPLEVDVTVARDILSSDQEVCLIDVREPYERDICQLKGALPLPMRKLKAEWNSLPLDKPLLLYCHHGQRSL